MSFIVFEGIDGSGKSTLVRSLCQMPGQRCVSLSEPTREGEWGLEIRRLLLSEPELTPALTQRLLELFRKDRLWDLETNIEPALANGRVVLLDRYFFSTAGYQAATTAVAQSIVEQYTSDSRFRLPDAVVYLKLDPDLALERLRGREDAREVFEVKKNLETIAQNYEHIWQANDFSFPVHTLDAAMAADELVKQACDALSGLIECVS